MFGRRALADADERDDRRDADDHAEHRQRGAEAARAEARQGEAEELERALMPRAIRPSRRWTWRSRPRRRPASWVMSTIVRPAAWSSRRTADDLGAGVAVEVAGRLVGEDERRLGDERAGDRDALLLAARQLGRLVVEPVAEAEPLERGRARRGALAPADALVEQRRRDVVERRRPRQQVVRLEDEADRPAAEPRQAVVVEVRDGRAGERGRRRRSAGRGSRGCSSSCSCPSRTARRSRRTRRPRRRG